jgi:hypothetical protein
MNVELLTAVKDGVISSIVVDYTINVDTSSYGSITESDETNNEYTGTYTLIHTSFVDSFY